MTQDPTRGQGPGIRRVLRKLAVLALGVLVFAGVSSIIEPQPSSAREDALYAPAPAALAADHAEVSRTLAARRHPQGWPLLGMLEGNQYLVLAYGAPGSRGVYTVCTLRGEVLAEDLNPAEVAIKFPSLDVSGMRLDPDSRPQNQPLMLAEPSSRDN